MKRHLVLFLVVLVLSVFTAACANPRSVICPVNIDALGESEDKACESDSGDWFLGKNKQRLPALELAANQVGVYAGLQQELDPPMILTNIGFSSVPASYTFVYPTGVRDLFTSESCPAENPYSECVGPLDGLVFANGISGIADMSLAFRLVINEQNASRWREIGGYKAFVGLLWGEIRSYRNYSSIITPNFENQGETAEDLRTLYSDLLTASQYGNLIEILSLTFRQMTIGDEAVRQALAQVQAEKVKAEQEAALLAQLLANEDGRQKLETARADYSRSQGLMNAEAFAGEIKAICAGVRDEKSCVALVWTYVAGKDVSPVMNQDGSLTSPQTAVVPTPAPGQ